MVVGAFSHSKRVSDSNSQKQLTDALYVDAAAAMKMHDDLLASQPTGARHDSDICPLCVEKASASKATTSDPSGSGRPDVSSQETEHTEGRTSQTMSDISQEAHDALVAKAVKEAVTVTESALATKTTEATEAAAKVTALETEKAELAAEVERLNKDLDSAQVKLTSATEEVASLKDAATKAEAAAQIAEVASKRADQVKNLGLFDETYVSEKASKWAALDEASWTEQVEEWKQLKPATAAATNTDAASAMSGTTESLTKETSTDVASETAKPKARRAALGLV